MRIECAYKELVEVNKLIPHPENRNKHSDDQVRALAKIIAKVGQRSPIVVSTLSGKINKGHCRWAAIKMLGWEKCAVDYQDYESELEELNDRIADNEIQRLSEFDHVGFMDDLDKLGLDKNDLDFEEFGLVDFLDEKIKPEKNRDEDLTELNKGKIKLFQEEMMGQLQRLTIGYVDLGKERDEAEDLAIEAILQSAREIQVESFAC